MPWFKVDDRAHGHPKVMAAGTAAYGLWARCGSYSAEHLTNGHVPKTVARMYGTPAMARRLVDAGLWHGHGHDCPRCDQPAKGDYVMHDYLDHNPSHADVEAEREAARKRMKRRRSGGSAHDVRPNTDRTNGARSGGVREPRPRPGVPTELSPRADDTTTPPADSTTGDRPEDRAGERDTNTALVLDATDATPDEATALLDRVRTELRPRSLPGLLRTIAANGDLQTLLNDMRATAAAPRVSPRDEWMYRQ